MRFWIIIAAVTALAVAYLVWVRPYLKSLPALSEAWQREASAWAALKVWLEGRKTVLVGMWGEFAAWVPDLLQIVAGVDLKTAFGLPDNWALLVGGVIVPFLMLIFRTKAKAA